MKKIISLFVALIGATTLVCAQTQIATLSHEGKISTFYGIAALKEAHTQAVDGDVITLSAGTFTAIEITKYITIRGAGMGVKLNEKDKHQESTVLIGDLVTGPISNADNCLIIEGICADGTVTFRSLYSLQFIKCQFNKSIELQSEPKHCIFIHCCFRDLVNLPLSYSAIACVFKNFRTTNEKNPTLTNCIFEINNQYNGSYATIRNCIIIYKGDNENNSTTNSTIYNSLWIGKGATDPFNQMVNRYNSKFPIDSKAFVDSTFYQLTDEAKLYLGSDETEVGIYGGSLPFDPTPSNPQITKFNVATKTTADGKLSVDIEVKQP